MKKILLLITASAIFTVVLIAGAEPAKAADRYWVGGTGSWDTTTTHWSTTSGGAGGVAVPTSSDNVIFDSASSAAAYTVTISATANSADLTIGNPASGVITLAGSSALNIYGSLSMATGMTRTYTGAITFRAISTGKTLSFNGVATASTTTFDGIGGGWILQDTWNNGSSNITLTNGNLNTNGQAITTVGSFSSSNSNTRTLTLGASTITCFNWTLTTTTGLTFSPGTSIIILSGNGGGSFGGGGSTYNEVRIQTTNIILNDGNTSQITGANTFAILRRTSTSTYNGLQLAANQTITNTLVITGNNANTQRMLIRSTVNGTPRTITVNGSITLTNVDFRDIVGAGTGTWSGTSIGDAGGNSGITFTPATTRYWVGGTGTWTSTSYWSASPGGASGASMPLPQDSAIFDGSSFNAAGQVVSIGTGVTFLRLPKVVNFYAATNNPTINFNSSAGFYGSLTLKSGMSRTGTSNIEFFGRGSETLTTGGVSFSNIITVDMTGGTLTLQDSLVNTGQPLYLYAGIFTASGFNVTASAVYGNSGRVHTVNMGSGTWTLTGTGTVWNSFSNFTINAQTSTIKITDASANNKTFFNNTGNVFYNIWFTGSGSGSLTINASSTYNDFKDDNSVAHSILFTTGTTTTVSTFTVSGTAVNLITINSTTTGTHSLVKTGGGVISSDYLNIQHSIATPANTWYAGVNSVNNQAVATAGSGWIFTAPPASGNRYWVGGTGNWSDATNHWATSSGGAPGSGNLPTSSNDVYFNASSFTTTGQVVTADVTANCATMDWTGANYTPTLAGSAALNIAGSLTFISAMTRTYTGVITFTATSAGQTLRFNGITMANDIVFDGVGGGWTLQDALDDGTLRRITLTRGSLNTNGKTVSAYDLYSYNNNTRTLTLGASTLNLRSLVFGTSSSGLTFNAGTSTINFAEISGFTGGSQTFNNVSFNVGASGVTLYGDNTYNNFTFVAGTGAPRNLLLDGNQTVTGTLTLTGLSATSQRLFVGSDSFGAQRTITAATVSLSNVDFCNIIGAGTATWSGTSIGNGGNNSGITFTPAVTRYWIGNGGNWWDTAHWSTSSGGTGGATMPLVQDIVIFDSNSITSSGQTFNVSNSDTPALDFTNILNNPTFSPGTTRIFGSLTLKSGMTETGSFSLTGQGSTTLRTNGVQLNGGIGYGIRFNTGPGTLTLQDDLVAPGSSFWHISGTFNANNLDVTCASFGSDGSSSRSLLMGSGTWTLASAGTSGYVWHILPTGLTLNAGTSTIKMTDASATGKFFCGGGRTYNNLWVTGTGTGSYTIASGSSCVSSSNNTFNDFKDDNSVAHSLIFAAGTTTTVTTFTVSGTAGNVITINSDTTATHSLVKSGGGVISSNYLNIQHSVATPANTWYAGVNSVNNQAVATAGSGWIFNNPDNPIPTTTSISPTSKTAGDVGFTLTVNGTNFISNSVVNFNGSARTTTYISATQLTASILTSDLTTAGTFPITVFNPTPGGGTSNSQGFTITVPLVSGYLISSTFDTGVPNGVNFNSMLWQGILGSGGQTFVKFQLATSNCPNGATDPPACTTGTWAFLGVNGTISSFYLTTGPGTPVPIVPADHRNKRYYRYKLILEKEETATSPRVDDVIVNWSP